MRIDVLTLFPEMFDGVFGASILGKARDKGIVSLQAVNFRNYANNKHNTVDDYPYGGGGGMVLKAEPVFAAVEDLPELRAALRMTEQVQTAAHHFDVPPGRAVHPAQGGGVVQRRAPRVHLRPL